MSDNSNLNVPVHDQSLSILEMPELLNCDIDHDLYKYPTVPSNNLTEFSQRGFFFIHS